MDYIITPHQAELNAAAKMREMGYTDAQATTGGSDGGIDVRSSAALAQVKWRGGVVGRPDLQNLYGARGSDTSKALLFFSASGFSKQATEYANQVGIELWVYDPTGAVERAGGRTANKGTIRTSWSLDRFWWVVVWVAGIGGAIILMAVSVAR